MAQWPSALPRWVRPAGRRSRVAFRQARSCARPAVVLLPQSQPAITAKPANPAKSAGLAGILRTACRRGQWGGDRAASASTPSLLGAAAWSGAGRRTVSRELSRAQGRARNRQAAPCRKGKGAQGTLGAPDTQGTAQSASAREQPARAACASRLSGWKRSGRDLGVTACPVGRAGRGSIPPCFLWKPWRQSPVPWPRGKAPDALVDAFGALNCLDDEEHIEYICHFERLSSKWSQE